MRMEWLRLWTLWCGASWVRRADGGVSRGPGRHCSRGQHYKHQVPLAPVIHGCLLPPNSTRREFAKWRSDTTRNYIPAHFDDYPAPFSESPPIPEMIPIRKVSLLLHGIWGKTRKRSERRKSVTRDIRPNGVSLVQIRIEISSICQRQWRHQTPDRDMNINWK